MDVMAMLDDYDTKQYDKGRLQKKKNCIFYDNLQKGRGSNDQNQISEKN